jgi:biopolymer transport protein ExbD
MDAHKKAIKNKAATRTPPEEDPEFQIAPMIDILLVLMVFFMSITTTEVLQSNQQVVLPVAKDAKAPPPGLTGMLTVNVVSKLGIKIDVDNVTREMSELGRLAKDKVASLRGDELKVLIRADRDTPYSAIKEVMRAVAVNGVRDVTFSVTDKEGRPQ